MALVLETFSTGQTDYVEALNANFEAITSAVDVLSTTTQGKAERGAPNGYPSLDAAGKIPISQLPDLGAVYQARAERGAANGYAPLDANGIVPFANLPPGLDPDLSGVETSIHAAATYMRLTARGAVNGVASLDAGGKVPAAQLPAATAPPYDLPAFYPGRPGDGATVLRIVMVRAVTFPIGLTTSRASAGTPATGTPSFTIRLNGAAIGSVAFTAAAGAFAFAAPVATAAGDVLTIEAPTPADETLADVSITLSGTR